MELYYREPGEAKDVYTVRVDAPANADATAFQVTVGDRTLSVAVRRDQDGVLSLDVDGRSVTAVVDAAGRKRWIQLWGGDPVEVEQVDSPRETRSHEPVEEDTVVADTPAQIVAVLVEVGQSISQGETVVILEAMKMEFRVPAPLTGRVAAIHCAPGEVVEAGQVLVELERE